ncbi:MAG: FKBP-type peptidyl-prolyl cis-trans isomerase [Deltaproteobacteria bacterium]
MTHFRLALLVCVSALACSGTDEGDAAETEQAAETERAAEIDQAAEIDPATERSTEGLPGLEAPPDVAAPPADAQRTKSGLASKRLFAGDGARSPMATDKVRVHYSGWRTDGMRFDSSVAKGKPAEFLLSGVIAGWTEGLQLMVEGEERRFWIPEALAYRGQSGYPAGMLVFDVQLIAILP